MGKRLCWNHQRSVVRRQCQQSRASCLWLPIFVLFVSHEWKTDFTSQLQFQDWAQQFAPHLKDQQLDEKDGQILSNVQLIHFTKSWEEAHNNLSPNLTWGSLIGSMIVQVLLQFEKSTVSTNVSVGCKCEDISVSKQKQNVFSPNTKCKKKNTLFFFLCWLDDIWVSSSFVLLGEKLSWSKNILTIFLSVWPIRKQSKNKQTHSKQKVVGGDCFSHGGSNGWACKYSRWDIPVNLAWKVGFCCENSLTTQRKQLLSCYSIVLNTDTNLESFLLFVVSLFLFFCGFCFVEFLFCVEFENTKKHKKNKQKVFVKFSSKFQQAQLATQSRSHDHVVFFCSKFKVFASVFSLFLWIYKNNQHLSGPTFFLLTNNKTQLTFHNFYFHLALFWFVFLSLWKQKQKIKTSCKLFFLCVCRLFSFTFSHPNTAFAFSFLLSSFAFIFCFYSVCCLFLKICQTAKTNKVGHFNQSKTTSLWRIKLNTNSLHEFDNIIKQTTNIIFHIDVVCHVNEKLVAQMHFETPLHFFGSRSSVSITATACSLLTEPVSPSWTLSSSCLSHYFHWPCPNNILSQTRQQQQTPQFHQPSLVNVPLHTIFIKPRLESKCFELCIDFWHTFANHEREMHDTSFVGKWWHNTLFFLVLHLLHLLWFVLRLSKIMVILCESNLLRTKPVELCGPWNNRSNTSIDFSCSWVFSPSMQITVTSWWFELSWFIFSRLYSWISFPTLPANISLGLNSISAVSALIWCWQYWQSVRNSTTNKQQQKNKQSIKSIGEQKTWKRKSPTQRTNKKMKQNKLQHSQHLFQIFGQCLIRLLMMFINSHRSNHINWTSIFTQLNHKSHSTIINSRNTLPNFACWKLSLNLELNPWQCASGKLFQLFVFETHTTSSNFGGIWRFNHLLHQIVWSLRVKKCRRHQFGFISGCCFALFLISHNYTTASCCVVCFFDKSKSHKFKKTSKRLNVTKKIELVSKRRKRKKKE